MGNFPFRVGSPSRPAVLAALIISGLLLAFHGVLEGAVQHGESRRQADAAHAEASLRCRSLQGPLASSRCLVRLDGAAGRGGLVLVARNFTTGLPAD